MPALEIFSVCAPGIIGKGDCGHRKWQKFLNIRRCLTVHPV